MRTARRKRTAKPRVRRFQLTTRDHEILRAVGRMGQAITEQLRRLFFGDPSTALRRLAKLVSLGLLSVHVCSPSEPNVYTLTERGLAVLENLGVERAELHQSRVGRAIDLHLRLLNDVRVAVIRAVRERPDVKLASFLSDLDLRRAVGSAPPPYIPDAIFEIETSVGSMVIVVEIDTGTEALSTFATKVTHTVGLWKTNSSCWGAGPGTWRPVVFVPSAGRARGLARAITDAGGGELWLVAEFGQLAQVGALGSLFALAGSVAATPRKDPIAYRGALAPSPRGVPQ